MFWKISSTNWFILELFHFFISDRSIQYTSDPFYNEFYCQEGSNSTIVLDQIIGETIEMKHNLTGSDILCEWDIETDPNKTINIVLTRTADNNEELGIRYNSSGTETTVTNKEMTECAGTGYSLEINDTSRVTIRAYTLTSNPVTYEFLIEQQGIDFSTPSVLTTHKALVEIVAICLVIIFVFLVISMIVFALCKKTGKISDKKLKRVEKYMNRLAEEKVPETVEVMDNMVSGSYQNMPENYKVKDCVI